MTTRRVAIFWDLETCPPTPSLTGYEIVDGIRGAVHPYGSAVTLFKAYTKSPAAGAVASQTLRSELQSSGVWLTDVLHDNGRTAGGMLLADMLTHAIDNPAPATIILISGDSAFTYPISLLRLRQYGIVVIVPSTGSQSSLESQASAVLDWDIDVLRPKIVQKQSIQRVFLHASPTDPVAEARIRGQSQPKFQYDYRDLLRADRGNDTANFSGSGLQGVEAPLRRGEPSGFMAAPPLGPAREQRAPVFDSTVGRSAQPPSLGNPRSMESDVKGTAPAPHKNQLHTANTISRTVPEIQPINSNVHGLNTQQGTDSNLANSPPMRPQDVPEFVDSAPPPLKTPSRLMSLLDPGLNKEDQTPSNFELSRAARSLVPGTVNRDESGPSTAKQTSVPTQAPTNSTGVDGGMYYSWTSPQTQQPPAPVQSPSIKTEEHAPSWYLPSFPTRASSSSIKLEDGASFSMPPATNKHSPPPGQGPPGHNPISEGGHLGYLSPRPSVANQEVPSSASNALPFSEPSAPVDFQPLIDQLEMLASNGNLSPLRSVVGFELSKNKTVYKQAGVAGFKQYVALAEDKGIVSLGGLGGNAWISLRPGWRTVL